MLNVGFIMAEENLLDVFKGRKIWLVTILRLIILPMIMIFCVRLTGITFRFPQTKSVLLISLLAAAAPTASSIAQFAEIADNDAVPAGKDQYTVNFVLYHYNAGGDHDLSSAVLMF